MFWGGSGRLGRLLVLFAFAVAAACPATPSNPCPEYGDVGRWSINAFKMHLAYTVPGADNPAFIKTVRDEHRQFGLYFHVENSVMKAMNDHYFKDKEITASVVSLYEQILMKYLMTDPRYRPEQVYSDYKSLRFAFAKDTPELRRHLNDAFALAAAEFKEELLKYPSLKNLFDFEGSKIRDTSRWHLGGFGQSADQAGTAARFARYHKTPEGHWTPPIEDFNDPRVLNDLNMKVTAAERYRTRVSAALRFLDPSTKALTAMDSAHWILSPAAIDILRKVEANSEAEYVKYVQDKFKLRFGLELDAQLVKDMQVYFHEIEAFAPSIFETQETLSLGLGSSGADGIVAADLSGQNVRNLHAVMKSVSEAARTSVKGAEAIRAVELARAGQEKASRDFELRRERFGDALTSAGLAGKDLPFARSGLLFSGDDGVFFPKAPLKTPEKIALLRKLSERSMQADDFRVTFLSPTFAGSLKELTNTEKADLISRAEGTEKELRKVLENRGVRYEDLKSVGLALDVQPTLAEGTKIKVWVTGEGASKLREAIEKALPDVLPTDFKADGVEVVLPSLRGDYRPRRAVRIVWANQVEVRDAVTLPFAA